MRAGAVFFACFAIVTSQSLAQRPAPPQPQASQNPLERGFHSVLDKLSGEVPQPRPVENRPRVPVEARVTALETRLKQEEQLLHRRLAQFAKMREAALQKHDQQALRTISGLERRAVENYQGRVEQILAGNPLESRTPARAGQPAAREDQASRTRREPPRRRGLFSWPFGR